MKHLFITTILILTFVVPSMSQDLTNKSDINIIPKPQSLIINNGNFVINENTLIFSTDLFNGQFLKEKLNKGTGYNIKITNKKGNNNCINIIISDNSDICEEGYKLNITTNAINIEASTKAGAFYGIQTLLQLFPTTIYDSPNGFENWSVPCLEIIDYPRFAYRGMMLDVSRTFFDIDVLYKYINWLSYHKINKLHLHLTDDNGWRIEIKKYPALTEKGAWRGPNEVLPATFGSGDKRYGGYYTQKQLKEFIKYASDRNIEIIPEIDLPGHSKALAACYPDVLCNTGDRFESVQGEIGNVLCVGNEHNYKMLDNIIKEIANLFPSDYIHIGGDEVNMNNWIACPKCKKLMEEQNMSNPKQLQNYFVRRMEKMVNKYGKKMAGWDEIIEGGDLNKNTRIYAWRRLEKGIEASEKGQPTVMQVGAFCYLDMKQSPLERGHNWAGIVTLEKVYSFNPQEDTNNINIIGNQVGLWTELLNKPARFIEYQTFPRICASAEVGWTKQELRNWDDFYKRLTNTHFERLNYMGIAFRLPFPTVIYDNNVLKVSSPYDGAIIRYTTDGTDPNSSSSTYKGDIVTYEPEKFRFATFFGNFNKSIAVGASNIELYNYKKINVTATSSLEENPKFPLTNICDNKFNTYFRSNRKAKKGDYIIYSLTEPILCNKIRVETGIPNIDFYGVTNGHIEYSYNGKDYIIGDNFKDNYAIINPSEAVKSIKIVIDGPNDGYTLCIQDLKIE